MRPALGALLATAALAATAGCGSSSSSTASDAGSSAGVVAGAQVTLISVTGAGGRPNPAATPLDTTARVQAFAQQFRMGAMAQRLTRAIPAGADSRVYGAVIAVGCDRPPGASVVREASGQVRIVAQEVASPLPECLVPVTTVAIAVLPAG